MTLGKIKSSERKHAKYSASKAERWVGCPGSVQLCEKAPPERENPWAIEGTKTHECLEHFIKNYDKPTDKLKKQLLKKYTPVQIERADSAAQRILTTYFRGTKEQGLFSEHKANLKFIHPECGGSLDVAMVAPFEELVVVDYKNGAEPVEAKDNLQLVLYALAIAHEHHYNFETVHMVIDQPQVRLGAPVKEWIIPIGDLKAYVPKFQEAIKLAEGKNPPLKIGGWCTYCPAKVICPEMHGQAFDKLGMSTKALALPTANKDLTADKLGQLLSAGEHMKAWFKEIEALAFVALTRGAKIPGYKLADKRGHRKWVDILKVEKLARKRFGDKAFVVELLSPAQFEKQLLDESFVKRYAASISSGQTMVKMGSEREAVKAFDTDFDTI